MYNKSKFVLLVDWFFDWFILPWYESLEGATLHHMDGHCPDPKNPGFRRDGYRIREPDSSS